MHYSVVYGRENEPWNEEDMFSWTVISLVCVDNKEDSTNRGTFGHIRRQQVIPHNSSLVPPCNSTKKKNKQQQQWQGRVLCKVYFAKRPYIKDITSPQQVRVMIQLDGRELHHTWNIPGIDKYEWGEYYQNSQ